MKNSIVLVIFAVLVVNCSTTPPIPKAFQEKSAVREADDDFNGFVITDPNRHALSTARVQHQLEKMNDDLRWEFKLKEFRTVLRGFKNDKKETKPSACKVTIYDFEKHKLKPKDKILIEVEVESDGKAADTNAGVQEFTFGSTEDVKMLDDPEEAEGGWRVYQTRNYVPYSGGDSVKWLYVNSLSDHRALRAVEGTYIPEKLTPKNTDITCEYLR